MIIKCLNCGNKENRSLVLSKYQCYNCKGYDMKIISRFGFIGGRKV